MPNPTIGIDWIGTVVNHLPIKLAVAREQCPELGLATLEEVRRERLQHRIGPDRYRLIGEEVGRRVVEYPLHVGAHEQLHRIHDLGITITVVTFTTVVTNAEMWDVIHQHNLPISGLQIVPDDREKVIRCWRLGIRAFLDDNESAVLATMRGLHIPLFLADFAGEVRQWASFAQRVTSWREFGDEIVRIEPTWRV